MLPSRPPRKVVNRYVGSGVAGARTLQEVPAVAYVEGPVAGVAARAAPAARVVQQDTAFTPGVLVVPVGTRVDFPNGDPFFHNVFSYSPAKRFDLGRYPRGESKSVVFDKPGAVKVYCEVHDYMRTAVLVVENPFWAIVDASGRFTIPNVPVGRYRLVVWHIDETPQTVEVNVPASGSVQVRVEMK